MEIKLNSVEHAQVELILEKIAAENNIKNVTAISVTMDDTSAQIKFAADDDKGTFETLGETGGKVVAPLVADVVTEGAAAEVPGANKLISDKGGDVGGGLGKKVDDFISGDKTAEEEIEFSKIATLDELAQIESPQAELDLTKISSVEELTKIADAYDVGNTLGTVGKDILQYGTPAGLAYTGGKALYDNAGTIANGVGNFFSGLTGGQKADAAEQATAQQPAQIVPSAGMDQPPAAAGVQQPAKNTQSAAPTYGGQAATAPAQPQASQQGMNPTEIADIQSRLEVKPDGIIGPNTQQAIVQYQTQNGLPADGTLNQETLSALYGVDPWQAQGYASETDYNAANNTRAVEQQYNAGTP